MRKKSKKHMSIHRKNKENNNNNNCGAREFVVPAHFPLESKARAEESSCRGQVAKVQMA